MDGLQLVLASALLVLAPTPVQPHRQARLRGHCPILTLLPSSTGKSETEHLAQADLFSGQLQAGSRQGNHGKPILTLFHAPLMALTKNQALSSGRTDMHQVITSPVRRLKIKSFAKGSPWLNHIFFQNVFLI